jgi:hypothetical protein
MQTSARMRGRLGYLIGVGVIALGLVCFVAYLAVQTGRIVPDTRVVVPGTHDIDLRSSGKYTVFYEYRSIIGGRVYSTEESEPEISASLTSQKDGRSVEMLQPSERSSYGTHSYKGVSVLQFRIEEPGTYVLTGAYDHGETGPDVVYAIGQTDVKTYVLTAFWLAFGGLVIGGLIIVVTFVMRLIGGKKG